MGRWGRRGQGGRGFRTSVAALRAVAKGETVVVAAGDARYATFDLRQEPYRLHATVEAPPGQVPWTMAVLVRTIARNTIPPTPVEDCATDHECVRIDIAPCDLSLRATERLRVVLGPCSPQPEATIHRSLANEQCHARPPLQRAA